MNEIYYYTQMDFDKRMMKTCEYTFFNGERCKEEALFNSKYCILHTELPEDEESEEFKRFNELKGQKTEDKINKGDFNFEGARLATVIFSGMKIEDRLNFEDATIRGDAWFKGATIEGGISFEGATIEGRVTFKGATVWRHARFTEAKIKGDVSFEGATIEGYVSFDRATIGGNASFERATIMGSAWFSGVTIERGASFEGTTIEGEASFENATIGEGTGEGASFTGARIKEKALFKGATIGSDVVFNSAVVRNASFDNATIGHDALFIGSTIKEDVSFREAIIGWGTWFSEAEIGGDATFVNATIGDIAFFDRARIGGYASFDEAKIEGDTLFTLSEISLLTFIYTTFSDMSGQEEACRAARKTLENRGDRLRADYHFYREMEAKRKQKYKKFTLKSILKLIRKLRLDKLLHRHNYSFEKTRRIYWGFLELPVQYIFGYGVHPWRVIVTWLLTVFSLAFIYWVGNGVEAANSLWECLYFSVVTAATPGYGGYNPKPGIFQGLATFEAIFGTFMWAVFIVTFARKYMR